LGSAALATLEIAIKEGPERGWRAPLVVGLFGACLIAAAGFVARTLRSPAPLVELRTFRDRNFSVGCLLSFALGMGLFGSVYLMPVFLAYVREHDALEIGRVMLVTGAAQLVAAPVAVALVRRVDDRLLTAAGFLLFATGLHLSAAQTRATDFAEMFWPQVARGCAIMFCILPPTQLALARLAKDAIPDASGLFNMMRNLGGAVGIAVIDTIVYGRAPDHARRLVDSLAAGDPDAARTLGIAPDLLGPALLDPQTQATVAPLVHKVALVDAINDAWAVIALTTLAALVVVPLARRTAKPEGAVLHE
jgi:DHA2 family multidrug resistance protein